VDQTIHHTWAKRHINLRLVRNRQPCPHIRYNSPHRKHKHITKITDIRTTILLMGWTPTRLILVRPRLPRFLLGSRRNSLQEKNLRQNLTSRRTRRSLTHQLPT
jgi:hypothetical protein